MRYIGMTGSVKGFPILRAGARISYLTDKELNLKLRMYGQYQRYCRFYMDEVAK